MENSTLALSPCIQHHTRSLSFFHLFTSSALFCFAPHSSVLLLFHLNYSLSFPLFSVSPLTPADPTRMKCRTDHHPTSNFSFYFSVLPPQIGQTESRFRQIMQLDILFSKSGSGPKMLVAELLLFRKLQNIKHWYF